MADYADFDCPECGERVYDNRQNKRNPKAPDFKCTSCDYVKWPPRGNRGGGGAPQRRPAPAQQRAGGNGGADRSAHIERQHSQEMALRLAAIDPAIISAEGGNPDLKKLRWYIDWFHKDVSNMPARPQPPQQRAPDPEPEPQRAPTPDDYAPDDTDDIPF